ncbi:hypothetical protein SAMN05421837_105601 [Amycolatopsis pretoriensis]|uniref:Uncharacterized protein n=1 Tax=Amycolatopsis pretoriensis TaxID=218821 RepID=A0A1H5QYB1_9PSEU|nr:hypothetical protein SAMN05421837_105601 [Amycolatopsis pretoriensis]
MPPAPGFQLIGGVRRFRVAARRVPAAIHRPGRLWNDGGREPPSGPDRLPPAIRW